MTKKVERKPPIAKSVKEAAEEKAKKSEPGDMATRRLFMSIGIVLIAVGIYFMRARVPVPTETSSDEEDAPEIKYTEHEITLKKESRNFTIPYPYGEDRHMCYVNVYFGEHEIEVLDYEVQKDKMLVKMKKKLQAKEKYDVQMGCAPYEGELPEVKKDTKTEYSSQEQKEYLFIETCRQGDVDLAKKMLDEGIDIDTKSGSWMGHTALHWASKNGDLDMLKLLLDHGAKMDILSEEEVDALQYATFGGHIEAIELLLDHGADIHCRDATDGSTPLHVAALWGKRAVAVYLLQRGADIERRTDKGDTPLHKAAWWGSLETVKLLMDRNAKINAMNDEGETPLKMAREMDRTEVIKYLELRGGRA